MEKELLNVKDVCRRLSVTRPTLLRLRRSNQFPAPAITVSARKVYWRLADIQEFLKRQEAQ